MGDKRVCILSVCENLTSTNRKVSRIAYILYEGRSIAIEVNLCL